MLKFITGTFYNTNDDEYQIVVIDDDWVKVQKNNEKPKRLKIKTRKYYRNYEAYNQEYVTLDKKDILGSELHTLEHMVHRQKMYDLVVSKEELEALD